MLYIVPTPIGNLKDLTFRALDALKEADAVFCEDTRRTLALMNHYGVTKKLFRYNEHSERSIAEAMSWLTLGKKVALVTDGGTPCISDPGRKLVALAREKAIKIEVLPGPSALITAAAGSGLPVDSFVFLGFLPRSSGKIKKSLDSAFQTGKTVILYESPYRIRKFLAMVVSEFGAETRTVLARELTKVYEEWLSGTAQSVLKDLEAKAVLKGEFVVLLRPPEVEEKPEEEADEPEGYGE
ncbi:MAG TPA: 16S rRNA (cytidine(1402)-2'-O)-methyltransferase [Elusimicrobia bacterium]|nr:16S rRNA (cytidine(1402)-2'-O)-methyltransferase [Elusimicrobiota bacterium]